MCKDIFLHRSIAVQLTITSAAVVYRSDFYSLHRVNPNKTLYGIVKKIEKNLFLTWERRRGGGSP